MELTANQIQSIFFQAFFLKTLSNNKDLFDLLSNCVRTEEITVNKSIFNISYLSYEEMLLNREPMEKLYPEVCMFFPENANPFISYDDDYKVEIKKSIENGYIHEPKNGYVWIGTDSANKAVYVKEFVGGYPRLIIRNELEDYFVEGFNKKLQDEHISNFRVIKDKINCSEKYFQKLATERTFYVYDYITQRVKGIDNPYKAFKAFAKGEYSKLFIGCENYNRLKEEVVKKEDKDYCFLSEYKNKTWADLYKKKNQPVDLNLSESTNTESLIKYGLESMILFMAEVYEIPRCFWKENYLNVLKMIQNNKFPEDDYCIEQANFRNYSKAAIIGDRVSQSHYLNSFEPNSFDELKPNLATTWRHTHKISTIDKDQMKLDLDNDDIYSSGMLLKKEDVSILKFYAKKTLSSISDYINRDKLLDELAINNVNSFLNGHYSLTILIDELTTSEYVDVILFGERNSIDVFESEDEKNKVINIINSLRSQYGDNSIDKELDDDEDALSSSDILGNKSNKFVDFIELKENEKISINSMPVFRFLKNEIEKYFIFDDNFKDYLINYFENLAYRYLYKDENNHNSEIKYHELTEIDIRENYDIWKPELKRIIRKIIIGCERNDIPEDLFLKFTGVSYEQYKKFVAEYKNKHTASINSYVKGTIIPGAHKEAGDDASKRERFLSKAAFEEYYNTYFSSGDCFRNLDSIVNYKITKKENNGKLIQKTPYKEYFEDIIDDLNKLFISWKRILKTYLNEAWKKYSEGNETITFFSPFNRDSSFNEVYKNLKSIKIDEVLDSKKIDDFTYQKLVFLVGFEIISSRTENRNTAASELWDTFYTQKYKDLVKTIKEASTPKASGSTEKYINLQANNGFYNRTEFNNTINEIYNKLSELTEKNAEVYTREESALRTNMKESFKLYFDNEKSDKDERKFFLFICENYLSKLLNKNMALSLFDMLEEKTLSFYFLIVGKPCNKSSSSFEARNMAYIDTLKKVKADFIARSEV